MKTRVEMTQAEAEDFIRKNMGSPSEFLHGDIEVRIHPPSRRFTNKIAAIKRLRMIIENSTVIERRTPNPPIYNGTLSGYAIGLADAKMVVETLIDELESR